jgi:murein DD-endopeptidase MepM/ murein hydrolase activator NlpD
MRTLISFFLICLPLKHIQINSNFGYRIHPLSGKYMMHEGVDFKARRDTVYAILDGYVESMGYNKGLGINICLAHGDVESVYGHLSQVLVTTLESVEAGQPIGITGATGHVTGEHLHFCIRYRHQYINPIKFLYELLKKQENEQNFQSTSDPAFRQAGRRN